MSEYSEASSLSLSLSLSVCVCIFSSSMFAFYETSCHCPRISESRDERVHVCICVYMCEVSIIIAILLSVMKMMQAYDEKTAVRGHRDALEQGIYEDEKCTRASPAPPSRCSCDSPSPHAVWPSDECEQHTPASAAAACQTNPCPRHGYRC